MAVAALTLSFCEHCVKLQKKLPMSVPRSRHTSRKSCRVLTTTLYHAHFCLGVTARSPARVNNHCLNNNPSILIQNIPYSPKITTKPTTRVSNTGNLSRIKGATGATSRPEWACVAQ